MQYVCAPGSVLRVREGGGEVLLILGRVEEAEAALVEGRRSELSRLVMLSSVRNSNVLLYFF